MNAIVVPSILLWTRTATGLALAAVLLTFAIVRFASAALALPRPGQFAVVAASLVAAVLLVRAGVTWTEIGFGRPGSVLRTLLAGLALYVAATAAIVIVVFPLARALGLPPMRLETFGGLRGNLPVLLATLVMVWTTVAFGEEFVFRGLVQRGVAGMLSGGAPPSLAVAAVAIVAQALVFGALHASFGPTGVLNATVVGLVFGVGLIATGGNLWPLVIAHGLTDTVGLVALYAGATQR